MAAANAKVVFLMADYGHDPTETAIPYQAFKKAGFNITFVTEGGKTPECDKKMLTGWTGALLGASRPATEAYGNMTQGEEWTHPLSWSDPAFTLDDYDLLFLPGGHERSVRQLLDSTRAQGLVAAFWPSIRTEGGGSKAVAAVCHGVQLLAHTKDGSGKSVLHDARTTSLTSSLENTAFWSTRLVLGDYYKTYGAGTPNVEDVVREALDDPQVQFETSLNPGKPLVVRDPKYNYLSGRWPGDAQALADQTVELVKRLKGAKA